MIGWPRKGRTGGGPRKRAKPLWRGPLATAAVVLVAAAAGGGAGWWTWHSGHVGRVADFVSEQFIAFSAQAGLTVQEILVTGRNQSSREALLGAVGLVRGSPTLAFDPHQAKARLEALPWVRSASVQRLLPSTVVIKLEERRPLALWQHQGQFRLIDGQGGVIAIDRLDHFSDLLVVVGEDAPNHATQLLELIANPADLRQRVKAAVRVGGRRWNLRLDNGIDVALPEDDPAGAWARLAEYERVHRILARDVKVLDLRLPDRLIVKPGVPINPVTPPKGRPT